MALNTPLTDGALTQAAGPCSPPPPSSQHGFDLDLSPLSTPQAAHGDGCLCFDCFLNESGSRAEQMDSK